MKIAVVPNAFKGSLTASEAAECIGRGLKKALSNASVLKIPMADGGDGTVQAIVEATRGRLIACRVHNPVGRMINSVFGISGDGRTAVIEMALASGLALLKPGECNPMLTSTRGTGELISAALDQGVKEILVGIGGSATNDGGMGMARALGIKFFDSRNRELNEGGGALERLASIDVSGRDPRLEQVTVFVACDVSNPLCGPCGASAVYGPQKGASPTMVKRLDEGLKRLATVIRRDLGMNVARLPGAGAAGGLGAGLVAFLDARMRPGAELVTSTIGLGRRITGCDLVITGEGRLDGQTSFGKAPAGVAAVAAKLGIPVIAICGSLGPEAEEIRSVGIQAFFSALEESIPDEDLRRRAPGMLERCATQVGYLLALGSRLPKGRKTC